MFVFDLFFKNSKGSHMDDEDEDEDEEIDNEIEDDDLEERAFSHDDVDDDGK